MSSGPFYVPGFYLCNVDSQAFQESKNGNPMIVFQVTPEGRVVTSFGSDGEPVEELEPLDKNYQRTARLVFASDDAADYNILKLRYAGWQGDRFATLDLTDQRVRMECRHEPGQGQYAGSTFERWEFPLPPRESVELESDDKVARRLDNLFGKKLKGNGAEKPKAAAKATPEAKAAPEAKPDTKGENLITDEEIPF